MYVLLNAAVEESVELQWYTHVDHVAIQALIILPFWSEQQARDENNYWNDQYRYY